MEFRWLCFATGIALYVQGMPDLSVPTYAIEYQGYHINIFRDTSVPSVPTFYYTPACFLLPNGTTFTAQNASPPYMTIKIALWDEEYTQHIRSYLSATEAILSPRIRPIPFKWMRIDTIGKLAKQSVPGPVEICGQSSRNGQFPHEILTHSFCSKMEDSLATDSGHFASSIQLAFAYTLPNTTKSSAQIRREHLQASHTFQTLNDRYPGASFIYVQKSDFDDLVQQVLAESVSSSFLHDEFVDDEQIESLLRDYSRKLRYNITSTAQFTESMWNVTFWADESQRPDVRAKALNALLGDGRSWLEQVLRGDNVTSETGISHSSSTVADAILELRRGKGHVQWSGSAIVVEPFRLWCVAMGALRDKTDFVASSVWVTKRTADYVTTAYVAKRKSAPEPTNVVVETGTVPNYIPSLGWCNPSEPSAVHPPAPTNLNVLNLDVYGGARILLRFTPSYDIVASYFDIYYTDEPALPDDSWQKEQAQGQDTMFQFGVAMFQKRYKTIKMRTVTDQGTGPFGASIQHYVHEPTQPIGVSR